MAELAEALDMEPAALLAPARRLVALGRAELDWRTVERDPLAHRADQPDLAPRACRRAGGRTRRARGACRQVGSCCSRGSPPRARPTSTSPPRCETLEAGATAIVLGARGQPGAADRRPPRAADRRPAGRAALGALGRGATRRVVAHPARRGARRGRHPDGGLRAAADGSGSSSSTRSTMAATSRIARPATTRAGWRAGALRSTGARVVLGSATPGPRHPGARARRPRRARAAGRAPGRRGRRPSRWRTCAPSSPPATGRSSPRRWRMRSARSGEGREQAVLLINRRGAATFILCRDCGESLRCPDCELPFVYHLDGGTLRCHHCGRTASPPRSARAAGAAGSATSAPARSASRPSCGHGTRACGSARLDSDALAARRGFETIYDDFREGRTDVLVGTQLAAKGLDLPSSRWPA